MRVLWVSSEMAPLCATGGLAEVAGALVPALRDRGVDVEVVIPLYAGVRRRWSALGIGAPRPVGNLDIALGRHRFRGQVLEGRGPGGVPMYLVDCPPLYDRGGLYGAGGRDFPDNALRFSWFCRAAAEVVAMRERAGAPVDVVHTHDWQTGLLPAILRLERGSGPRPGLIQTIHNLAYVGSFPAESFPLTGFDWEQFTWERLEFYGDVSYLKAGLVYADRITTVSPGYAREICTPAYGEGLEGLLLKRSDVLTGILNGIDLDRWNPASDTAIAATYESEDFAGKAVCREALRRELELEVELEAPVLGMVTRLVHQKGVDLLLKVLDEVMAHGVGLAVLGSGDPELEGALRDSAEAYPGRIAVRTGYDEGLARRIFAGSDVMVMPSRYEPCGLTQMQAMRYGTPPIVRRTGGLADTVTPVDRDAAARGTGFVFDDPQPRQLAAAISRAVALWPARRPFRRLARRCMEQDWSWTRSAARYEDVYRELESQGPGG
jgi:starch synthase